MLENSPDIFDPSPRSYWDFPFQFIVGVVAWVVSVDVGRGFPLNCLGRHEGLASVARVRVEMCGRSFNIKPCPFLSSPSNQFSYQTLFGPTSKASKFQSINIYTMKLFNIFAVAFSLVMASGGLASAIPSPKDEVIVETIVHDDGPTSHSSWLQKPNVNHQVTKGDHQSSAEEMEERIKDPAKEKDVGDKHDLIQSSPQKSCSFQVFCHDLSKTRGQC